ncbi:MAG: dihydropteroate synthase [Lentisphaeria bacterium]|nr:dihydropteroate synthase [Lentisphaeria bacterium]
MMRFTFIGGEWRFDSTPKIMGVLNVTPDSFSDGGDHRDVAASLHHARAMAAAGADVIDIGGESTRPGAREVPAAEEIRRVCPVIQAVTSRLDIPVSVDTRKAAVAAAAVEAGAVIINDVSGLTFDSDMIRVVKDTGAGYIGMHMRGTPETMQSLTDYGDIMAELKRFFHHMLTHAVDQGVSLESLAIDPGIGFGKTGEQNIQIIQRLAELRDIHRPVLMGVSRKSFIGETLGLADPKQRAWGTAAAVAVCVANGAHIHRVHDVAEMRQVADMAAALTKTMAM